ncbi:hypothetical protein [Paenibacillus silvisoli]|uniref:hypothetical protein n=1 Tax=Paenibacillus silvisoli TaxID=3110539 RepID=UPI0028055290|nr:hypothetical protein [Paenibacillus silvisoli]
MKTNSLQIIVKNASKEIWEHNIAIDYDKNRLRREASLQSNFYFHLRNKIGDATLDFFNAVIYTEYHYKGKRVDLAVVQLLDGKILPIAIFEFKYKNSADDTEFKKDVTKIINYIDDSDVCTFYIGFIQEAEYADLNDSYTWLEESQIQKASGRVIEMTGGLYRPDEESIWSFKEVGI